MKPFTLLLQLTITPHKNGGFQKRSSKWIFTKMEVLITLWISVNAQKRIKTKTLQQQQQDNLHISRQIQL